MSLSNPPIVRVRRNARRGFGRDLGRSSHLRVRRSVHLRIRGTAKVRSRDSAVAHECGSAHPQCRDYSTTLKCDYAIPRPLAVGRTLDPRFRSTVARLFSTRPMKIVLAKIYFFFA